MLLCVELGAGEEGVTVIHRDRVLVVVVVRRSFTVTSSSLLFELFESLFFRLSRLSVFPFCVAGIETENGFRK